MKIDKTITLILIFFFKLPAMEKVIVDPFGLVNQEDEDLKARYTAALIQAIENHECTFDSLPETIPPEKLPSPKDTESILRGYALSSLSKDAFCSALIQFWRPRAAFKEKIKESFLHSLAESDSTLKHLAIPYQGQNLASKINKWMLPEAGNSSFQCRKEYCDFVEKSSSLDEKTKKFYVACAYVMFTPSIQGATSSLIPEAVKQLQEFLPENRIYAGNINKEGQEEFEKLYPIVREFSQENRSLSYLTGLLKPTEEFFSKLTETYNLDHEKCLWLERDPSHIPFLRKAGFTHIVQLPAPQ